MNTKELKTFSVHPSIIYSIITKQASGLPKALLELAMNSVDAGATRIDLEINKDGFIFTDNGRGFNDLAHVISCFEMFGTPHADGDAYYGRFRIGRAQLFSYCSSIWHTKNILMHVDLKQELSDYNQDVQLGYNLSSSEVYFKGCKISGTFYEPQNIGRFEDISKIPNETHPQNIGVLIPAFAKMVKYLPVSLYINGQLVTCDINKAPYLAKSENLIFTIHQVSEIYENNQPCTINVFNKGVFAYQIQSDYFSGDIVSLNSIDLNMARNAAKTTCPIAKEIRQKMRYYSNQVGIKKNNSNFEFNAAEFVLDFWKGILGFTEYSFDEFKEAMSLKVFLQGNDTNLSLSVIISELVNFNKKLIRVKKNDDPASLYFYDINNIADVFSNQKDKLSIKNGLIPISIFPPEEFMLSILDMPLDLPKFIYDLPKTSRNKIPPSDFIKFNEFIEDKFTETIDVDCDLVGSFYSKLLKYLVNVLSAIEHASKFSIYRSILIDNPTVNDYTNLNQKFFSSYLIPINLINVSNFESNNKPVKSKLNPFEKIVLNALNSSFYAASHVSHSCFELISGEKKPFIRDVVIEVHEEEDKNIIAWTDGAQLIVINSLYFKEYTKNGDFDKLVFTLFHELAHNGNSIKTLSHGASFYFVFKHIMTSCYASSINIFFNKITSSILLKVKSFEDVEKLQIPHQVLTDIVQKQLTKSSMFL